MSQNFRRAAYAAALIASGVLLAKALPLLGEVFRPSGKVTQACQEAIDNGYCQNKNKCDVIVTVNECGRDVRPTLVPDPLHVCDEARITWRLTSSGAASGAKFANNGVAFKASDGGTSEFDEPKVRNYTYEYRDKHSKAASAPPVYYDYGMHILKSDASPCIDFDPRIYNE